MKESEAQKKRPKELLWTLWFDKKEYLKQYIVYTRVRLSIRLGSDVFSYPNLYVLIFCSLGNSYTIFSNPFTTKFHLKGIEITYVVPKFLVLYLWLYWILEFQFIEIWYVILMTSATCIGEVWVRDSQKLASDTDNRSNFL